MEFPQKELFTNWCERNSGKETHHAERRANGAFSRAETDSVSAGARVGCRAGGWGQGTRARKACVKVCSAGRNSLFLNIFNYKENSYPKVRPGLWLIPVGKTWVFSLFPK